MSDIDWTTGKYQPTSPRPEVSSCDFTLALCGDWAPLAEHQRALAENAEAFYGDLLPALRDADLTAINFEGAFVPDAFIGDENFRQIVKDGLPLLIPPETMVKGLSAAPFRLACLANNHILDFGGEALSHTQELLARESINYIGAGSNAAEAEAPRFFQFGETRLAVINVAEAEEARAIGDKPGAAGFDLCRLEEQLRALAGRADVRVVIAHAGREHIPAPAPYIQRWYRALVDAGANLVIGHHPHVPQGVEIYKGVPIAYSLGNFTLYVKSPLRYHSLGYFVTARFCGKTLAEFQVWPYRIGPDQLALLKGNERIDFLEELQALSRLVTEPGKLEAVWDAFTDMWLTRRGLDELSESLAQMGMGPQLMLAALKSTLPRYNGKSLNHRLARKALWWGIHRLENHPRPDLNNRAAVTQRHWGGDDRPAPPGSAIPTVAYAASVLRNRFDTPAHRELYLNALKRVMEGSHGNAPDWAKELLKKWGLA